jgi:hypothetical protein
VAARLEVAAPEATFTAVPVCGPETAVSTVHWRGTAVRLVRDREPVVEGGHVGADDEPGDIEGALGGVVSADDVQDGRSLGDAQPGGLGAGWRLGGDLLLDLGDRRYRVDAGDVPAWVARAIPGTMAAGKAGALMAG